MTLVPATSCRDKSPRVVDFRSEYENDFPNYSIIAGFTLLRYVPVSSHDLPSVPETDMKSEGSENVTVLKFENRTRGPKVSFVWCKKINFSQTGQI